MYRNLGLDLAGCAKLLHVTERTLHNWASGKHDIPYATYRLLRLLNRMELPGPAWAGWCFHGGKLWSPEGRSFVGTDSNWWSLLIRRADMAAVLQRDLHLALGRAAGAERAPQARSDAPAAGTSAGMRSPVTPHPSLTTEKNCLIVAQQTDMPVTRPSSPKTSTPASPVERKNRSSNDARWEAA